jgi:chromosome segregation ATPase
MDSWEEGFDNWVPRSPRPAGAGDDTGTDLDRAELLRLARELAERRQAGQTSTQTEVEQPKRALRERAEAIAARERELAELQRRLESGRPAVRARLDDLRPRRGERRESVDEDALAARERAVLERTRELAERERAAEAREQAAAALAAELEVEIARLAERERDLAAELEAARAKLGETDSERELAKAERERLEERDRAVHEVERQLAAARISLERERRQVESQLAAGQIVEQDTSPAERHAAAELAEIEQRELLLASRESHVEAREREIELVRRRLESERNALLERERMLRRREVQDVHESFAPLAPPSFSEGLAALAHSRARR